ncbi:LamB/YcsF family protein [Telmatospirillum sp. J64-1]|uniref:LamB/YcsF family protein n=1 Tax=Telmatospirillum sp. J64-1 TaxID=2502183 RepID=UPI00115E4077|nr:5-oxoprolinase subunit PxpA [Telmatospirillum sp. J64-1]
MRTIDLNCDCGESYGAYTMGNDEEMLKIVSSANIACGFHAGDPLVLHRTLSLAKENGVGVGAHPSFLDQWGFGRRRIEVDNLRELEQILVYQIAAVQGVAQTLGLKVRHVKPHGSLGNMAAEDYDLALAIGRAIKAVDPTMLYLTSPGNQTQRAAEDLGLPIGMEIFADRAYDEAGNLMSRRREGAIIHDADYAAERILRILEEEAITTVDGKKIPVKADTICVHGDNPNAVAMARKLRDRLVEAGYEIRPMWKTKAEA